MADTIRREFAELPDEFDGRGPAAEPEPERKRKGNWLLSAAAVLLLLPMTVLPQFFGSAGGDAVPTEPVPVPGTEPAPEPVPEPEPEPVEEHPGYEIIGTWQFGEEYYSFFEDGTGCYYAGSFYVPVTWKEAAPDYDYAGCGMIDFMEKDTQSVRFSGTTAPGDGGIYLLSQVTGADELFTPADSLTLPPGYEEYGGDPEGEAVLAYWIRTGELVEYPSVLTAYLDLREGGEGMMQIDTYFGESTFIPITWEMDPASPNKVRIYNRDGGQIVYVFTEGPYSETYTADVLNAYYFVDEFGEGLVIYDFGHGSVMRKDTDY